MYKLFNMSELGVCLVVLWTWITGCVETEELKTLQCSRLGKYAYVYPDFCLTQSERVLYVRSQTQADTAQISLLKHPC